METSWTYIEHGPRSIIGNTENPQIMATWEQSWYNYVISRKSIWKILMKQTTKIKFFKNIQVKRRIIKMTNSLFNKHFFLSTIHLSQIYFEILPVASWLMQNWMLTNQFGACITKCGVTETMKCRWKRISLSKCNLPVSYWFVCLPVWQC